MGLSSVGPPPTWVWHLVGGDGTWPDAILETVANACAASGLLGGNRSGVCVVVIAGGFVRLGGRALAREGADRCDHVVRVKADPDGGAVPDIGHQPVTTVVLWAQRPFR